MLDQDIVTQLYKTRGGMGKLMVVRILAVVEKKPAVYNSKYRPTSTFETEGITM